MSHFFFFFFFHCNCRDLNEKCPCLVCALPFCRVFLVLPDWKVKEETPVLRWERSDAAILNGKKIVPRWLLLATSEVTVLVHLSLNGPRVCTGSAWCPGAFGTTWQSWQEGEWTRWPATLSLCSVCAHMPLCLLLCGCLYLWPLLKRWEAYFQFNKQLLDMCLKACAASNPRINGRAANLSENAKMGKLATDMGHK